MSRRLRQRTLVKEIPCSKEGAKFSIILSSIPLEMLKGSFWDPGLVQWMQDLPSQLRIWESDSCPADRSGSKENSFKSKFQQW